MAAFGFIGVAVSILFSILRLRSDFWPNLSLEVFEGRMDEDGITRDSNEPDGIYVKIVNTRPRIVTLYKWGFEQVTGYEKTKKRPEFPGKFNSSNITLHDGDMVFGVLEMQGLLKTLCKTDYKNQNNFKIQAYAEDTRGKRYKQEGHFEFRTKDHLARIGIKTVSQVS